MQAIFVEESCHYELLVYAGQCALKAEQGVLGSDLASSRLAESV